MRAYGHGFGLRYDLPLPLALWIIAGTFIAILFVPLFFRLLTRQRKEKPVATETRAEPAD